MSYKNARDILPKKLLEEIQKYVQGEQIYIPQKEQMRNKWGSKSGAREALTFRNKEIIKKFRDGLNTAQISELFCLSEETIRKIVYLNSKRKE